MADSAILVARATAQQNNAVFGILRDQILDALYPPTSRGFRARMIVFVSIAA